jgi:hypothetical protein
MPMEFYQRRPLEPEASKAKLAFLERGRQLMASKPKQHGHQKCNRGRTQANNNSYKPTVTHAN